MNNRTVLYLVVGFLAASILIVFASNLQAGSGSSLMEMLNAQRRTPLLWVVDACALGLLGAVGWYAVLLNQFQKVTSHQAQQHIEQLDDMIERANELERVNDDYSDRIERLEAELHRQTRDLTDQIATLEAASDARRGMIEAETHHLPGTSLDSFLTSLDANTRQVEAMNMAVQFQRGEIRKLRQEIHNLQNQNGARHAVNFLSPELLTAQETPLAIAPAANPDDLQKTESLLNCRDYSAASPSGDLMDALLLEHSEAEPQRAAITERPAEDRDTTRRSEIVGQPEWFLEYSGHSEPSAGNTRR
jgi:hypothetical protein